MLCVSGCALRYGRLDFHAVFDEQIAFEMWVHRRMLRILWRHHISNQKVLTRARTQPELLVSIKKRNITYYGHIIRSEKYHFIQLIIQGKIESRRPPGRRRTSWLINLRQWFGKSTGPLYRAVASKIQIVLSIANFR